MCVGEEGERTEQAEEGDDGDGAEGRLHRRAELARKEVLSKARLKRVSSRPIFGLLVRQTDRQTEKRAVQAADDHSGHLADRHTTAIPKRRGSSPVWHTGSVRSCILLSGRAKKMPGWG